MTSSKIERGRILVYSEKFPPYRLELERKENLHMGNQMPRQKHRPLKNKKSLPYFPTRLSTFAPINTQKLLDQAMANTTKLGPTL